MTMRRMAHFFSGVVLFLLHVTYGFVISSNPSLHRTTDSLRIHVLRFPDIDDTEFMESDVPTSRRSILQTTIVSTITAVATTTAVRTRPSWAASDVTTTRQPLDELLYRIVRVREATQQETRLITTGKFKDVQRANIKLAVRFMVENYRLNDAFVAASTYLEGSNNRRLEASQVGQSAVQNLYTILEYFDSADIENLKVGQATLAGKEGTVLRGLDATRKCIDDFLSYFPKSDVDKVLARVSEENALNIKEFDPALGTLLNIAPAT